MQTLWKYVDDLVGKGFDNIILFKFLFYASATLVPMALPLAILLASIMTFGNLGEHFELTAIKIIRYFIVQIYAVHLFLFVLLMSGVAFYFSNNILPVANLKLTSLLYTIRHQKPTLSFDEGIFNNDIDGYSIKVGSKAEDGQHIYDIMIYDHTSGKGSDHVIVADSGRMFHSTNGKVLIVQMHNGSQYKETETIWNENKPLEHSRTYFDFWEMKF